MITLSSISRSAKFLLLAAALATSFTVSAEDNVPPPSDIAKVAPISDVKRITDDAAKVAPISDVKRTADAAPINAITDAKIPKGPPAQSYCVCCAKGGPYTVTASTLPSPNFAAACKANNAGPIWSVVHVGPIPCTCKGIKGPRDDLKKYVP
jgi:hypothetical protein